MEVGNRADGRHRSAQRAQPRHALHRRTLTQTQLTMPETIDDFMKRFGGPDTMDDK